MPGAWIALKESSTIDNRPDLRRARTFVVPIKVEHDGLSYMAAHVKITPGGVPAPRLHFHDDTGGATGKIYIGYLGEHLHTADFS